MATARASFSDTQEGGMIEFVVIAYCAGATWVMVTVVRAYNQRELGRKALRSIMGRADWWALFDQMHSISIGRHHLRLILLRDPWAIYPPEFRKFVAAYNRTN